jgi:hypothetical protein
MNLYLDDDSIKKSLVALLGKGGHKVVIPAEVGLRGRSDARQLHHALGQELVLLSRNYQDFIDLHDLIAASGGHHSGIVLIREDNDRQRDMTDRQIVAALGKLEHAGESLTDKLVILNKWR